MPTINELPEHVLHEIISTVIDSSRFRGWQISLRLINRGFNEIVLHVFFLQKHLKAARPCHLLDCIRGRHQCYCAALSRSPSKQTFCARFNLQTLLVLKNPPGNTPNVQLLLGQLKAALTILRGSSTLQQLDRDQNRFYSTCSNNAIFNDVSSAILAEAISGCVALNSWGLMADCLSGKAYSSYDHLRSPRFWVALCGCALDDLKLVKTYTESLTPCTGIKPSTAASELEIITESGILLRTAVRYSRLSIIRFLLARHTILTSETCIGGHHISSCEHCGVLRAAIFSRSSKVLEAVLEYTPRSPELLELALHCEGSWLVTPEDGSDIIRLLVRHFAPLAPELRARLIVQSCAVGDITLLEEFLADGPLFAHYIYDCGGQVWTYLNIAVRCGHAKVVRFLLDHGVLQVQKKSLTMALEQSVMYNQIECFRELYVHCDLVDSDRNCATLFTCYQEIGGAENAEDIMSKLVTQHEGIFYKDLTYGGPPSPSAAQSALWYAINRLRAGNVQFLLHAGVRLFQWQSSTHNPPPNSRTPFDIEWPYFNQNRHAFGRTQAVLDAFSLSKLRVIV